MNYVLFIVGNTDYSSDGVVVPDALAVMQREIPIWSAEMKSRGLVLYGRELDLPETASTVRVRDGETMVVDGPFTESKEFVAGFSLLDCADLDEAIEVATKCPISWFHTLEIRPAPYGLRLGEQASAFGRSEDGDARAYGLIGWMNAPISDESIARECDAWRDDLRARGAYVLGNALGGTETATTLRPGNGSPELHDGPFAATPEYVGALDVVSCADRKQAIQLAATHPIARYHAIEVRPFYVE